MKLTGIYTKTWRHCEFMSSDLWYIYLCIVLTTLLYCTRSDEGVCTKKMSAGCLNIISRSEWGARDAKGGIGKMGGPAKYVFIHHGASDACTDKASCMKKVRDYQDYHLDHKEWSDIGYSFVVGEDGNVYMGRGWTGIGAHTKGYNADGIGICVISNFMSRVPNEAALNTVKQLIQSGLDQGHISSSYTLKGHRDVGATECPGDKLYSLIQNWPHYKSGTQKYA